MSKMHIPHLKLRDSERGMVSILTTMVLMIVISLIVLGFATVSRRNQRESLDRQLSTQAFYAAESGINDVRELIQAAVAAGNAVPEKDGCTDTGAGGFYATLNPDIDAAKGVKYSCMLVDPSPTVLRYGNVGTTSVVIPMVSSSGANFTSVRLAWQSKMTGSPVTGCPVGTNAAFTPTTTWSATCGLGVLRFDLVPTAGALSTDGLRNSTMTVFAVPLRSGGVATLPYAAGTANTNNRVGVACTSANGCVLTVNGLTQNSYHLRVTSLYRNVAMQVSGNNGGTALEIEGAQAVIDVTGKASDVLRRIQVNVPLRSTSQNELSDYAIQSTDSICKRYSVMNGYFDNDAALSGVTSNSANRLCTSSP